jgi:hypothetical protein
MRIPGIGNIKKLTDQKAIGKAMDMVKKAGIRKPVYVIQAEYKNFCSTGKRSAKDKTGFLSVMHHLGDENAKEWIEEERTKLDKIIMGESEN